MRPVVFITFFAAGASRTAVPRARPQWRLWRVEVAVPVGAWAAVRTAFCSAAARRGAAGGARAAPRFQHHARHYRVVVTRGRMRHPKFHDPVPGWRIVETWGPETAWEPALAACEPARAACSHVRCQRIAQPPPRLRREYGPRFRRDVRGCRIAERRSRCGRTRFHSIGPAASRTRRPRAARLRRPVFAILPWWTRGGWRAYRAACAL